MPGVPGIMANFEMMMLFLVIKKEKEETSGKEYQVLTAGQEVTNSSILALQHLFKYI